MCASYCQAISGLLIVFPALAVTEPPSSLAGAQHEVRHFPRMQGNIPLAWLEQTLAFLPLNAQRPTWTRDFVPLEPPVITGAMEFLGPRVEAPAPPHRVAVEVPAGGRLKVALLCAKEDPLFLSLARMGPESRSPKVQTRVQTFTNTGVQTCLAEVQVAQARFLGPERKGLRNASGPWPYRIVIERSWEAGAWRKAREREGLGDPSGLPLRQPAELRIRFAAEAPTFADTGLHLDSPGLGSRRVEAELILNADGHPRAVLPRKGHPALLKAFVDWAWQLAFEPGSGLPERGSVRVPLEYVFLMPERLGSRP